MEKNVSDNLRDINNATLEINNIISTAAEKANLRKCNPIKNTAATKKQKKKLQKWYDKDCSILYKHLIYLGRNISNNPNNHELLKLYNQKKKQYKKLLKKRREHSIQHY